MTKQSFGIGIVGAGAGIANLHAKAVAGIPNCAITGVWNRTADKAHEFTREHGGTAHGKYSDLLADPAVDIVDVCVPSGLHAEFGIAAAAAGKHVIVERPLEVKVEEADALIDACAQHGVRLTVMLPHRLRPGAVKLKKAVEDGWLGRILLADAYVKLWHDPQYYSASDWKGSRALCGGVLLNQGIHCIDLLLHLVGDARSVDAITKTARHDIEAEDLAVALIEFANGALGVIEAGTSLKPGTPERVEVRGTKGTVMLRQGYVVRWEVDGCREEDYVDELPHELSNSAPNAILTEFHRLQLADFAHHLQHGTPHPITGEEAMRSLQLVTQIHEANEQGIRIRC
ncbi:Gfo/Idh/MocA family protein [Candidatus Sumerlaeota bacterium]